MRIRNLGLITAVCALVAGQNANAAPVNAQMGHLDPLLSLSFLSSEHSRAIACAGSDIPAGEEMAPANANCAAQQSNEGVKAPEPAQFASGAATHTASLTALPAIIFGFATWIGLMFSLTSNDYVIRPVSPS